MEIGQDITITLCCVDCINHELAIEALKKSKEKCVFDRVLFLTDRDFSLPDIETIKILPIRSRQEYSMFVLHELHRYIDSDFVLLVQWDGYIINPNAWTNEFLNFDYIGAVWGHHKDGFRVGNGGFSLRSRKLLLATRAIPFDEELAEDELIGRKYRPLLEEQYQVRFAPESEAEKFSFETTYPARQPFGFHGLFNIWMTLAPNEVEQFIHSLPSNVTNSIQFFRLGINYRDLRQFRFAEAVFQRILENNPAHSDARSQLAAMASPPASKTISRNATCACGSGERYKNCCGKIAVTSIPRGATREEDIQWMLSVALKHHQLGHIVHANTMYGLILHEQPQNAVALQYSGVIAYQSGSHEKALKLIEQAIQIQPSIPDFHNNLGLVFQAIGDHQRATECYRQAIALNANYVDAYNNLGLILEATGRPAEAVTYYERAIALRPDFAQAHWNLSLALLATGNFLRGWDEYEWRLKTPELAGEGNRFTRPLWNGEDLRGKTILLHAEQGFGDAIQFIRYAPLVASLGGHILFECKPALKRLFKEVEGIHEIILRGDPLSQYDFHCPLLSLPPRFRTAEVEIPVAAPYLFPDEGLVEDWRKRMPDTGSALKVGLVWAGSPGNKNDLNRSIALSQFDLFGTVENVVFFNLQKGSGEAQANDPLTNLHFIGLTEDIGDFASTAALIANLDLVICVDTSVAHLAGAIGKPAWVLLPFAADWRWLLEREDSPWYPSLRLFRQCNIGNWEEVVVRVRDALCKMAA
ncbi:MAG: Tfp pilus assembly protein PilF [Candidatus Nitrotoga sp. LAW]|nr:MAG: Tfp pilus assembly protein PilF [Candidatus Nitrotoga sp. LAW]